MRSLMGLMIREDSLIKMVTLSIGGMKKQLESED